MPASIAHSPVRPPAQVQQSPAAVVMVRPHRFSPNPETAADNAFQQARPSGAMSGIWAAAAHAEVTAAVDRLMAEGVTVHLFDDFGQHDTPDSVFPNNWFSTHGDGRVALHPMYAPSRRRERRADVLATLREHYQVTDVVDDTALEAHGQFLEGTGAMVLDHIGRVAYTGRSRRADSRALARFCSSLGFEPLLFDTADAQGQSIYHTNVLLCIGTAFAMGGFEMLPDATQRQTVRRRLEASGRILVELSAQQIGEFAGNALELEGRGGRLLALSQRAYASLSTAQRRTLEQSVTLMPLAVPTIELAGGSVRCMLAGVHLKRR